MWTDFNSAQIAEDFQKIAGLGANTVRLIVDPTIFGFPTVNTEMDSEFTDVLTLAAQDGLHVQLTLFDWWDAYSDVADSDAWAESLLSGLQNDPQIAFIELKNEIDPTDGPSVVDHRSPRD